MRNLDRTTISISLRLIWNELLKIKENESNYLELKQAYEDLIRQDAIQCLLNIGCDFPE